jgi:hypothetical protein
MCKCMSLIEMSFHTGQGVITYNQVSRSSSSPFILVGETSGGPPTTYTWTRNGITLINSSQYRISISVDLDRPDRYTNARYISTLTVTGSYPGVYEYSVRNRATSTLADSIDIEGMYIIVGGWRGGVIALVLSNQSDQVIKINMCDHTFQC